MVCPECGNIPDPGLPHLCPGKPDAVDAGLLASLPLLAGVDPGRLQEMAAAMRWRQAEAGEVLARQGEPGATFGLMVLGEVEITVESPHGPHHIAFASTGSVLGELAVLRGRPRMATLTAVTPACLAIGDAGVLEAMLAIPEVHDRLRRLASNRLAHDLRPVAVRLAGGDPVLIRPLLPEDRPTFDAELRRLSQDSLRRRFFSPGSPSQAIVDYLVDIDYIDHFAWVVIDPDDHKQGLATARYVRDADDPARAETAFGTADRYQGRGIGTFLLGALAVAAREAGINTLVGHVLEDNAPMRAVFAKAAATAKFGEPGVLVYELQADAAAALLDDATRSALAAAVHDIVTAGSLALAGPHPTRPG